ncbi:sialidase family protein [Coraliomargarita parva]|uniref:sialidase family protein n=1 Tax=Coraliomargarita parva TaxID=3014050 RepID=UPI0022B2EF63|nr:sialidase family protein [Coraliomargarita parva]
MQHFIVSRDDSIYQAWPDLALTQSGRLVCVFSECTHHFKRTFTRIVCVISDDRGVTWSEKRPISEPLHKQVEDDPHWNCARITALSDGRLIVIVDRIAGEEEGNKGGEQSNWFFFSDDDGETWTGPMATPFDGMVPDQVIEIPSGQHEGRWLVSTHKGLQGPDRKLWEQRCWYSDDAGATWEGPFIAASSTEYQLCEGSIMALPTGELVCYLRENSGQGFGAFKTMSRDGGSTWSELVEFPLCGCHRPVSGLLQSGHVLITYRFLQGGAGPHGWGTQNFFAALTDQESCLAESRKDAHARIMPIAYDRSDRADLGYSGWVQFPDGEIYIVYYIKDDAPQAHIRGCSLREDEFYV